MYNDVVYSIIFPPHLCRLFGFMDPARLVIFLLSLLLITHASQKAVKLDRENRDDMNKEGGSMGIDVWMSRFASMTLEHDCTRL